MDFGLTDEQRALDASVRDYLTDRFDLAAVRKVYDDLGGDWFTKRTDTDKRRDHLIRQLQDLGYGVSLTNLAA